MARWTLGWSSFRRVTSDGSYIPEIDGLRFVAILSVLLFHIGRMTEINYGDYVPSGNALTSFFPIMLFHGGRGVELFFAISGMILGLPFARHYLCGGRAPGIGKYFLRRLTRLEPPYIVNLLIRLPLVAFTLHWSYHNLLPHFFASLFYLHGLVYHEWPVVHPPSWSLEIEVQFYILAPLLALLAFRKGPWLRRSALLALILLAGLLQAQVGPEHARFHLSILEFIQYFLVGFLISDLYTTEFAGWRSSWAWDALCIPLWFAMFYMDDRFAHYLLPLATLVVYIGAFKGRLVNFLLRQPLLSTIGGMCYSLYLTHSLLLQAFYVPFRSLPLPFGFAGHLVLAMVLLTPLLIIFGSVFFLLIERPCMDKDWPRHLAVWLHAKFGRREVSMATHA
jgi:peptidoglycan/LPS O-acetylase OafA/YrhL